MWNGFIWNHFCFDAGNGGGRKSDITQNLHIKTKVCCRWKKYNCGYLFLFDIFLSAWHRFLSFTLSSCVCCRGTCYRSSLCWISCRPVRAAFWASSHRSFGFCFQNHLVCNSGINSCKYQSLRTGLYSSGVLIQLVFVSGLIWFGFIEAEPRLRVWPLHFFSGGHVGSTVPITERMWCWQQCGCHAVSPAWPDSLRVCVCLWACVLGGCLCLLN